MCIRDSPRRALQQTQKAFNTAKQFASAGATAARQFAGNKITQARKFAVSGYNEVRSGVNFARDMLGRAGFKGQAISFVGPKDWDNFIALKKYLQQELTFLTVDGLKGKFKGLKDKTAKKPSFKGKKPVKKSIKKPVKSAKKLVKKPIPAPFDIDGQSPLKRKPRVSKETPIQDLSLIHI